jgi:hypothetical protein
LRAIIPSWENGFPHDPRIPVCAQYTLLAQASLVLRAIRQRVRHCLAGERSRPQRPDARIQLTGAVMSAACEYDGQIAYDLEEFCQDYGHPAGQLFTFEVTCDSVTYVYANVEGTVHQGQVIFDLNAHDLVGTRKAN